MDKRILILVVAVVALASFSLGAAANCTIVPTAGCTINQSIIFTNGAYNLNDDGDGAIVVNVDNVTIDCNGSTINETSGETGAYGFYMTDKQNVTIVNCTITNYGGAAVYADNITNLTVSSSIINNSGSNAILLRDVNNSLITSNTLVRASSSYLNYGISFSGSLIVNFNNTISNNTISGLGTLIVATAFLNNTISGNTLTKGCTFECYEIYHDDPISGSQDAFNNNLIGGASGINLTFTSNGVGVASTSDPGSGVTGKDDINKFIAFGNTTGSSWISFIIKYADSDIARDEASLSLYRYGGVWSAVPSVTVDTAANTVSTNTSSIIKYDVGPAGVRINTNDNLPIFGLFVNTAPEQGGNGGDPGGQKKNNGTNATGNITPPAPILPPPVVDNTPPTTDVPSGSKAMTAAKAAVKKVAKAVKDDPTIAVVGAGATVFLIAIGLAARAKGKAAEVTLDMLRQAISKAQPPAPPGSPSAPLPKMPGVGPKH